MNKKYKIKKMKTQNLYRYLIILTFFIFIYEKSSAQEGTPVVVRDFETWNNVSFKLKINKKFSITADEELRLWHNSSKLDEFFTNIKFTYKLFKNFQIAAGYRFIKENNESKDVYETHQRFAFDADYNLKFNRFSVSPRIRFQLKDEIGVTSDDGDELINKFRV